MTTEADRLTASLERVLTPSGNSDFARPLAVHFLKACAAQNTLDVSIKNARAEGMRAGSAADAFAHKASAAIKALRQLARSHQAFIHTAIARGRIEVAPPRSMSLANYATFAWENEPRWREVDEAIKALQELEHSSRQWGTLEKLPIARPRHRPSIQRDRVILAGWVALSLAACGITPTKTRDGVFALVLELVYKRSSFRVSDPMRDVRAALDDVDVRRLLRDTQKLKKLRDAMLGEVQK